MENVFPVSHGFAKVNGVNLHYAESGSGELVILLHGFPEVRDALVFTTHIQQRLAELIIRGHIGPAKRERQCRQRLGGLLRYYARAA